MKSIFTLLIFVSVIYAGGQEKNLYALIEDQHGNAWSDLTAKLFLNHFENNIATSVFYDSVTVNNGILEFQDIVITGINSLKKDNEVQVFPNPCKEKFKIQGNELHKNGLLNIYNTKGQKVKFFFTKDTRQEFDISGLNDGIYFCEFLNGNQKHNFKLKKSYSAQNNSSSTINNLTKSGKSQTLFAWLQITGYNAVKTTLAFELDGTQNLGKIIINIKERIFTDERDGKHYKYTNIGNQTWMAENLAWLPAVAGPDSSSANEPFYYVYNFTDTLVSAAKLTDYYKNKGVLYNFAAALESCPAGWRLPSKDDWDSLATFIQNENNCADVIESAGRIEWPEIGEYLKSESGWTSNNGNNKYDFNGIPGGYVAWGDFYSLNDGKFWSSTEGSNANYVWAPGLGPNIQSLVYWTDEKERGHNVRCIAENKIADTLEVLQTNIGPQGGKITMGNFVVTIPPGAFSENVKLSAKLLEGDPFGENIQKKMLQLEGLPVDYTLPIQIKTSKNIEESSDILLLEDVLTKSLNAVTETVIPLETTITGDTLIAEIPIIEITKSASGTREEKRANVVRLVETEYKKYKVESAHFTIHNLMYQGVDRNHHLDSLASYLEKAYEILSKAPYNFSLSKRSWPMNVFVKPLSGGTYGKFQESMFGRNYSSLTFNGWKLFKDEDLKASAIHEFFHLIQSFYDTRSSFLRSKSASTSYWFDEAVSVWSEQLLVKTSDFISGARKGNEFMPFTGLRTPLEDKEGYGYGMSAFIKYLIDNYGFEYIKKIYESIEIASIYPVNAIDIEIPEEIHSFYHQFIAKYALDDIYKDVTIQTLISRKSQKISLNNSSSKTISINEMYKNLSSKIYTFDIEKTALTTQNSVKIITQNQNVHFLILKYKKNAINGEWEKTKAAEGKGSVEIKNIKQIFDDGFNLMLIATLCDPNDKTYYLNTKSTQNQHSEHNVSINFELVEVQENLTCQIDWVVTGKYEFDDGSKKDTSIVYATDIIPLEMPLTKTGLNTYSSTFDHRSPFGGSYYSKGQFSITVNNNSHVDISLNVTDSYINDQTNEHKNRKYKIIANNIPYEKTLGTDVKYDFYKLGSSGFWNYVEKFEFNETNVEISTGNTKEITFVEKWDNIFNEIYIKLTYK